MEVIIDAQCEQGEQDIPSVEYDEEKYGDDSSIEEAEEEVEIILNRFKGELRGGGSNPPFLFA